MRVRVEFLGSWKTEREMRARLNSLMKVIMTEVTPVRGSTTSELI
jgi:hypothetical protein